MKPIKRKNTARNNFEDRILDLFKKMKITAFHDHGNIDKYDLKLHTKRGKYYLEFDIVAVIGKIGIIVETKGFNEKNVSNMRKFTRHANEFADSSISLPNKIKLLKGIPSNKRIEYNNIQDWRFVFASLQNEIIEKKINEDAIENNNNFIVLNKYHIAYLEFLVNNLGEVAKYEFLDKLGIDFVDADIKNGKEKYPAIKVPNRRISKTMGSADLYLFTCPVSDLLKMSRVDRYGSLRNWTPEAGEKSYQRILASTKLADIRDFIKSGKEQTCFPNTITAIINEREVDYPDQKLELPIKFGVLDIIDGQHRLFGFANSLNEKKLEKIKLLVSGIHFTDISSTKLAQWNAQTFVEINRNQKKVPTELILLVDYSVMKNREPTSLAAEALKKLSTDSKSKLYTLLKTTQLPEKSKIGKAPIKFVTIAETLKPIFSSKPPPKNAKETVKLLKAKTKLLKKYFKYVAETFPEDWNSVPNESLIFSTHYLAIFCKLLIQCIEKNKKSAIKNILSELRKNLEKNLVSYNSGSSDKAGMNGPNGEIFWEQNTSLPEKKNLTLIKKLIFDNVTI